MSRSRVALGDVPGVELAIPMVEGSAFVSSPFQSGAGALVRGVRGADIKRLPGIAGHVKSGTLDGFATSGGVAIGQRLAENLELRVGDKIKIITAAGAQTPFGVAPRIKAYPITAIFQIGMAEFDNHLRLSCRCRRRRPSSTRTMRSASSRSSSRSRKYRRDAAPRSKRRCSGRSIMTDWRERNRTFFDALKVERNVMFIILTLIVLVAALNIISGLIMLVKDKSHDIAILRTMGATRGAIMRIFLITGASIGVGGTFAGFLLGLLVAGQCRDRSGSSVNGCSTPICFRRRSISCRDCRASSTPSDVVAVVGMTLACPSSRRSIRHGAPRGSIRSKPCDTNEP